jgi:hypothetical protein
MNNIDKGVIQVLDQLKNSGQLNSYLIDDDERKWTKLVYDIMINKFDMPFGNSTMQQASDIFNNAVRVWKGKNKLGNMMNMESRTMNMNIINEIGDTVRGQEMLGRTAERAHQRAQRTSGADKQRHEKTEWDAYQTAAGSSRKHLDGSGAHFARGRDAEYDEHWDDGRYPWSKKHKSKNESRNMNKKLIRLTESDLHKIVKESVEKIIKEHDMYALGRVSGRALERSADIERDMARKGIPSPNEISKMKNQDRIAHNANRLHNKLLGLNPDEEFGHINDEDFGNGMRDAAIDHKFRKRG